MAAPRNGKLCAEDPNDATHQIDLIAVAAHKVLDDFLQLTGNYVAVSRVMSSCARLSSPVTTQYILDKMASTGKIYHKQDDAPTAGSQRWEDLAGATLRIFQDCEKATGSRQAAALLMLGCARSKHQVTLEDVKSTLQAVITRLGCQQDGHFKGDTADGGWKTPLSVSDGQPLRASSGPSVDPVSSSTVDEPSQPLSHTELQTSPQPSTTAPKTSSPTPTTSPTEDSPAQPLQHTTELQTSPPPSTTAPKTSSPTPSTSPAPQRVADTSQASDAVPRPMASPPPDPEGSTPKIHWSLRPRRGRIRRNQIR